MKLLLIAIILFLTGCATGMYQSPDESRIKGAYHRVEAGETLYSMAKKYGIEVREIVESNKLPDKDKLSVGQLIFIPERDTIE